MILRETFKNLSFLLIFNMDIKILKDEKNELVLEFNNQTVAEVLRVYLNNESDVKLAAWKNEHYSKPIILKLVTDAKPAKKVLNEAIAKLQKDLKKYSDEFKKSK